MNIYYYNEMYETLNEFVWATADRELSPIPPGGDRAMPPQASTGVAAFSRLMVRMSFEGA